MSHLRWYVPERSRLATTLAEFQLDHGLSDGEMFLLLHEYAGRLASAAITANGKTRPGPVPEAPKPANPPGVTLLPMTPDIPGGSVTLPAAGLREPPRTDSWLKPPADWVRLTDTTTE